MTDVSTGPGDLDYIDIGAVILRTRRAMSAEKMERFGVGMSQVGGCPRKIWYTAQQTPEGTRDLDSELTFALGDKIEELIIECMLRAGYDIRDQQLDVMYKGIPGHIDGMLYIPRMVLDIPTLTAHTEYTRFVVEVKSISGYGFKLVEQKGLLSEKPEYWLQLQGYIAATGADGGLMIMVNKEATKSDNDRLLEPDIVTKIYIEWVAGDRPAIDAKLDEVNAVIALDSPPDRPYPVPVKFPCSYCAHMKTCWGPIEYESPAPKRAKKA